MNKFPAQGAAIASARKRLRYTMRASAATLGVSYTYYRGFEQGSSVIPMHRLRDFSNYFMISYDDLMKHTGRTCPNCDHHLVKEVE